MKPGDPVQFNHRDRWRDGTIDHVNGPDSILVKADDEEMKYAVSEDKIRERPPS